MQGLAHSMSECVHSVRMCALAVVGACGCMHEFRWVGTRHVCACIQMCTHLHTYVHAYNIFVKSM